MCVGSVRGVPPRQPAAVRTTFPHSLAFVVPPGALLGVTAELVNIAAHPKAPGDLRYGVGVTYTYSM